MTTDVLLPDQSETLMERICRGYLLDKEGLIDALISVWHKDGRVGCALCEAACVPRNIRLTKEQCAALVVAANRVAPFIPSDQYFRQRVRLFMAHAAGNACDALWDDKPDLAKKILMSGNIKRTLTSFSSPATEARQDTRKVNRTTRYVRARELDKNHDWMTVK